MKFPKTFKWFIVITSLATSWAIIKGIMPAHGTLTRLDTWLWLVFFIGSAVLQMYFLLSWTKCFCGKRVWSDFILQLSGVMYLIFACMFGAKYPPFTWPMGVYPILAVLCLFFGKIMAQQSQEGLKNGRHTRDIKGH